MTTDGGSHHAAPRREFWSGRLGFLLATTGAAIGLGSIWKFPYEVGANGGGVFLFFYLAGLALVVLPLLLVEFALGRRGGGDAVTSIARVARAAGRSPLWRLVGGLGVLTSFLILSFYSVVGGWAIAYAVESVGELFAAGSTLPPAQRFDALLASPARLTLHHTLFMLATAAIVAAGIVNGIERACRVLMPLLILLMVSLALYGVVAGDVAATARFLFRLDFTMLTPRVALEALGLGFFSIGVGLAVMITYAAHAGRDIDLTQVAVASIIGDTVVSLLAGFAIFPIVFAHGLDPSAGPRLMFVSLPIAFAQIPAGAVLALAFFLLLTVAAIASAISLLEMPIALVARRAGVSRLGAALLCAGACWAVGLVSVFSFNWWAGWFPLAGVAAFAKANVFDLLDFVTSNVLLPAGGFALALLCGWLLPAEMLASELGLGSAAIAVLRLLLRFVVPAAIAAASLAHLMG